MCVSISKLLVSKNLRKQCRRCNMTLPKPCAKCIPYGLPDVQQAPRVIDFSSDSFSMPSKEMQRAMFSADIREAGFNGDPVKIALEKKAAALFGKEDAVLVATGCTANLVSILVHCKNRPSEIVLGNRSHIKLFEQMGATEIAGAKLREIENNPNGTFDLIQLRNQMQTRNKSEQQTRLICVENTHMTLGGQIMPLKWLDEVVGFAKSENWPLHMDGSRIINASVKSEVPVSRITQGFDSIIFALSKGLGCPYGSVILGSEDFISQANKVIKMLGGGCRQIGYMAAAGIYALDNMIDRHKDDHKHIQMLANAIRDMNHPHIKVPASTDIHTNILNVDFDINHISASDFLTKLATVSKNGPNIKIKALSLSGRPNSIRFVTCGNITMSNILDTIEKFQWVVYEFN